MVNYYFIAQNSDKLSFHRGIYYQNRWKNKFLAKTILDLNKNHT